MAVVAGASALVLAGCGGGGTSNGGGGGGTCTSPTGGTTSGTAAQTVKVVSDPNTVGKFDPSSISVKTGDTIEWDFQDSSSPHTVTADDGSFDSCSQQAGFKFFVTFSKAGDVKYHCTLHAQMLGDIKVS
jgi:plastocyanin